MLMSLSLSPTNITASLTVIAGNQFPPSFFHHSFLIPSLSSSTATLFETISTPIVTFDFDGSTCGSVVSGNALDFRLIGVPDDGSVEITWTQVQGQSVGNCPNGFVILFFIFLYFFWVSSPSSL